MKKSFLALAVAALAATSISTASAATVYDKDGTSLAVYGRVQSVLYSDKAGVTFQNGDKVDENATLKASGRLGVDMRTQVYGDIAAFAKMEWDAADGNVNANNDEDDSFSARYLWVGLDFAQAGQVKFGRFEPAIKYAISQTDIFDDWGCNGLAGNDDKRKSMLQYSWSGYGFDAIASYGFANSGEHVDGAYDLTKEKADLDYSVSLAAGYTSPDVVFGPIAVRAGYEKVEFADSTANKIGNNHFYDSYNQYAIGLSWGSLNLGPYVGAVYHEREFDVNGISANDKSYNTSVTGYEFVVGYSFANGISARTGYLVQEYKNDADKAEAKTVPVYVNWQLNPQVNVWAEARFDAGTDDATDGKGKNFQDLTGGTLNTATGKVTGGVKYDENVFSAGIRYQF
ncbi:porin [Anaerobiospirillum succiniciproducens]|uniref:porin n=1 Tax=Anaerobiospirillum succiniciproducens TaxID=13335 RepID=UPI003F8C0884